MPKYTFTCEECNVRFDRNLKMGDHPTHPCPACKDPAPRLWDGQGFGFEFSDGAGTPNGNSGVAKHDYPTADIAVGRSASARWREIDAREGVKRQVRKGGKTNGLIRKDSRDGAFIDYEAMTPATLEARKELVDKADAVKKAVGAKD